jgi:hypothetical protein
MRPCARSAADPARSKTASPSPTEMMISGIGGTELTSHRTTILPLALALACDPRRCPSSGQSERRRPPDLSDGGTWSPLGTQRPVGRYARPTAGSWRNRSPVETRGKVWPRRWAFFAQIPARPRKTSVQLFDQFVTFVIVAAGVRTQRGNLLVFERQKRQGVVPYVPHGDVPLRMCVVLPHASYSPVNDYQSAGRLLQVFLHSIGIPSGVLLPCGLGRADPRVSDAYSQPVALV